MRLLRFYVLSAVVVVGLAQPLAAQTVATTTTLAANATATDTVITVTSATGFTVGDYVWADYEQMLIRAISGTRITVQRGVNGTAARAHDNTERVIEGPSDHFKTNDPDFGADCARGVGQAAYSPWINVRNGYVWMCGESGGGGTAWTATVVAPLTLNSIPSSF